MTSTTAEAPRSERVFGGIALRAAAIILQYRMLFVGLATMLFVAMVTPKLIGRRSFTAEAIFVPQERTSAASGLASLAAQFGVNVPSSGTTESPAFYQALIKSREILTQVVRTEYPVPVFSKRAGRATLMDIWEVEGSSQAAREEEAVRRLREGLGVDISREINTVGVNATSSDPALAAAIVQRVLDLVNEFNVNRRQTQSGAERRFLDGRLEQERSELERAEQRLSEFLRGNRVVASASQLRFEQDRLERNVSLHQQIYTSLAQSYEQAKISEARNLPVITVIERPTAPVSPNRRRLVSTGLRALVIGFVLAFGLALTLEYFRGAGASQPADVAELRRLWRDLLDDVRHPVRAVQRAVRRA